MERLRRWCQSLCYESHPQRAKRLRIAKITSAVAISVVVLVTIILIAHYTWVDYKDISWKELTNLTIAGNISRLEVVDREWARVVLAPESETRSNKGFRFYIGSLDSFEKNLEDMQHDYNIDRKNYFDIIYAKKTYTDQIVFFGVLWITLVILCVLFHHWEKKKLANKSVSKLVNTKDIAVRFADVGGCEEAKIEIMEYVNYLNNPDQYIQMGAKLPKGAILTGPPGTGKTLLAKATAREANAAFIAISGSDFVEVYGGLGAARVRDTFKKARANSPCILFIDEIDAIGSQRKSDFDRELTNTLNQLLVEMDGFSTTSNVIVLAATNRIDSLDKALLRKGRFDRIVNVPAPDTKARTHIFNCHLRPCKTHLDKQELSTKLAALTSGLTGADIASICNEAAMLSVRYASTSIDTEHFEEAVERCIVGIAKKNDVWTPAQIKTIAYHEAGHVVAGWFSQLADPWVNVSIIPCGDRSDSTLYSSEARIFLSKDQLFDKMCAMLGGRVAEEIFFGRITTGAQYDLESVTKSAYDQVAIHGMSEKVGIISFDVKSNFTQPYSERTAQLIDDEVRLLVDTAYTRTKNLIVEHKADVKKVAECLLANTVLYRNDILALLGPRPFADKCTYEHEGTGTVREAIAVSEPENQIQEVSYFF